MSTQPKALRLADALDNPTILAGAIRHETAAELRHLHASCEDYAQHKERQDQRILALVAQRDALLEALKTVHTLITEAALTGFNPINGDWPERLFASQQATFAAIKAAEEGK